MTTEPREGHLQSGRDAGQTRMSPNVILGLEEGRPATEDEIRAAYRRRVEETNTADSPVPVDARQGLLGIFAAARDEAIRALGAQVERRATVEPSPEVRDAQQALGEQIREAERRRLREEGLQQARLRAAARRRHRESLDRASIMPADLRASAIAEADRVLTVEDKWCFQAVEPGEYELVGKLSAAIRDRLPAGGTLGYPVKEGHLWISRGVQVVEEGRPAVPFVRIERVPSAPDRDGVYRSEGIQIIDNKWLLRVTSPYSNPTQASTSSALVFTTDITRRNIDGFKKAVDGLPSTPK